jgi:signal peptidase I
MLPTLNVGDVIIVQGVPASQIYANYVNGDIVVFKYPMPSDPNFRIVHRAVKIQNQSGVWWITTHGDNNALGSEEIFNENDLIGKVVARIPYVGNFSLFTNKLGNSYFFIVLIVIIIGILFSLFTDEEKESAEKEQIAKKKLFGKLDVGMVFYIILDVLLVGFLFFNLFGSFTFWQIGAEPPQDVTIRGMYPDLQYYLGFRKPYNYVHNASLSQGFLTYTVNCFVTDGAHQDMRPGVPTFSWVQASLLILLLFNVWMAVKYFHIDKKLRALLKLKTETKESSENILKT